MAIAFEAVNSAASGSAVTELSFTLTGTPSRQLLIATFGFENVLASSGPWVVDSDGTGSPPSMGAATGWQRVCWKPPSADGGNGIEVWAVLWGSGTTGRAVFDAARTVVYQIARYTGIYDPLGSGGASSLLPVSQGIIRASTTAQVTGNNPAGPSVYAFVDERVVTVASSQLDSSGYSAAPTGYTKRLGSARSGTHGNVEIGLSDAAVTTEGDTGSLVWTATAASGSTKGATATLAIRPAAGSSSPPTKTSPYISFEYA